MVSAVRIMYGLRRMGKALGNTWLGRDWHYSEAMLVPVVIIIPLFRHLSLSGFEPVLRISVFMQEEEGNVRPRAPNFMGFPPLRRDIVVSCSVPFGCLGAILYWPSAPDWIGLGGVVQAGTELPGSHVGSDCYNCLVG